MTLSMWSRHGNKALLRRNSSNAFDAMRKEAATTVKLFPVTKAPNCVTGSVQGNEVRVHVRPGTCL